MLNGIKLIIWDFDGVIADTEHLWIKNWQILLDKYFQLGWDFETANRYLGGLSPKSKIENLKQQGIDISQSFLNELRLLDWERMKTDMYPVEGVEDIFKLSHLKQCIATGGNIDKTEQKLKILDFEKYFDKHHIFSAEQVENGKPAPDLFLLAAEKMGAHPEECLVIEDSLPGLTAAINAEMTPVAFIGCPMNNNAEYIDKIKRLGIKMIFDNMYDLKEKLL